MSSSSSFSAVLASAPLTGAPVTRRDGQWWLVSSSGSLRVDDPGFTHRLDRLAAAMAAANQAIAATTARRRADDDREPQ